MIVHAYVYLMTYHLILGGAWHDAPQNEDITQTSYHMILQLLKGPFGFAAVEILSKTPENIYQNLPFHIVNYV